VTFVISNWQNFPLHVHFPYAGFFGGGGGEMAILIGSVGGGPLWLASKSAGMVSNFAAGRSTGGLLLVEF
jgi:hypothetical protein